MSQRKLPENKNSMVHGYMSENVLTVTTDDGQRLTLPVDELLSLWRILGEASTRVSTDVIPLDIQIAMREINGGLDA